MRINDLSLLDPGFRRLLEAVVEECQRHGLPLEVFETIRTPARQEELYARGRDPSAPDFGRTVTKARKWQSAHQYGLGADCVFKVDGKWSWDPPKRMAAGWAVYHTVADSHGLVPLSFEKPHVQARGFNWRDMEQGPDDVSAWMKWLRAKQERA
jgi:peptidoglycan LD-endopeptidase CwlK